MGNRHPAWEELLVVHIGVTIFFRVKHTLSHKLASQAELSKMYERIQRFKKRLGNMFCISYRKNAVPGNTSLSLA
jgi:hypothetical protein